MRRPQVALLADGRRLHLQDGPIDLVIEAFGAKEAIGAAYVAAARRLTGLLDELVAELPLLRAPVLPWPHYPNSKRDQRPILPRTAGKGDRPEDRGGGVHVRSRSAPSTMRTAPLPNPPPQAGEGVERSEMGGGGSNAWRNDPSEQSAPRAEPPALRATPTGVVARRMHAGVAPFADECFITPMAAVAGAVADEIIAAMTRAAPLARAYVNNGGDIALHLRAGEAFALGLVDRPDRPSLFACAQIMAGDPTRGIATSGWRGRSFSLGIADAVTILAATAAQADAAATIVANAVDLPGHPAIARAPAASIKPDNDLGDILVTRAVGRLDAREIAEAIQRGLACARALHDRRLIDAAAIHLQGETRVLAPAGAALRPAVTHAAGVEIAAT
jgi:hypothetical protein